MDYALTYTRYLIDHTIDKPILTPGPTVALRGDFASPYTVIHTPPIIISPTPVTVESFLLAEGDAVTGYTRFLFEGDQQSGSDLLDLEGSF